MEKGRGNDGKDQQQRGKGKMPENQMEYPQQPPPHHRCPRCGSDNTKFCYYNNYSYTQPRYFCKTCRRYWTHGGSLRNVPVGGGSRRANRDKASSSSNGEGSSRSVPALPAPPHPLAQNLSGMVGLLSSSFGMLPGNRALKGSSSEITPASSLYSCNGFISSLAAMENLNLTPPYGINRPFRIGGNQVGGSGFGNMSVLQDFNRSSNMRPQHPQLPPVQQQNNLQQMNSRGKEPMHPCDQIQQPDNRGKEPMYPPDRSFYPATRPMGPWNQSFSNNNINPMDASSSTFWNGSSGNTGGTSNGSIPGSSLDPNEWPDDLPDFDPPEI